MKVSIFIDGNNFYHGLKYLFGESRKVMDFDFEKFCNSLTEDMELVNIFYYNASLDKNKNVKKYESQKRFFNKLKKVPRLRLILCKLLKRSIKGISYYVLKEDDIHMAVDIVEGACEDKYGVAILVSGDGDFVPAVESAKRHSKVVENVYFKNSSSRNLKKLCDRSKMLTKEMLEGFFD
jgi:uncharacterized LabA/DUF88 family protein